MDPRVAANRALWDEWTPIHVRSDFYDVEGWKSGAKVDLYPLLVDEVGDVAGKDLLHLQCHFGLDTLAWARRGARVTGVDISERGIQEARRLAAETGPDATFVVSDVVELPATLEGCDFDVVFTSFGALNWLPDVPRWAEVVGHFVRPGGFFYIAEAHPFAWVFDDDTATELRLRYHYWPSPEPLVFENEGSYADPDAPVSEPFEYAWQHSMARSSAPWPRPGCASSTCTSTPGCPGRRSRSWPRPSPDPACGGCRPPTPPGCPCCTRSRPPRARLAA
jgi:SAM-dependent methyltransferase